MTLQPQERRLVVGIGTVVFVVLNLWFVWPHFGDWKRARAALEQERMKLARYQRETNPAKLADCNARLKQLEGEGSAVATNEQALNLISTINNVALQCGFNIDNNVPVPFSSSSKTNEYFEEKAQNLTFSAATEKSLVDFLVSLGSANSMIRAKTIQLKPNQSHTHLQGSILIVASYQKAPKSLASAATLRQAASSPRPATASSPPPRQKAAAPPPAKSPTPSVRATSAKPVKPAAVNSNAPAGSRSQRDKSKKP